MIDRWLALYPPSWRKRYGQEVIDLANELIGEGETTSARTMLDLAAGAIAQWWRLFTSQAVLAPVAATAVIATGAAVMVHATLRGAAVSQPYFEVHQAGWLLVAAELGWLAMELAEFRRGRRSHFWRERTTKGEQRAFWPAAAIFALCATAADYLAPPVFPAAAIRPGTTGFTAGLLVLLAGMALRWWSFSALHGRYFNFSITVDPDQPVVSAWPVPAATASRPRWNPADQHRVRSGVRELGGRSRSHAAAAGGYDLAHPRRRALAAERARRALPSLRRRP